MSTSLGAGFVWFVIIVAAIPIALWLLKRTPYGAAMSGARGGVAPMRTITTLPLGTHQKIVTIEVGQGEDRRWLVLGVTTHSINALHEMAPQPEPAAVPGATPPALAASFSALLDKARRGSR